MLWRCLALAAALALEPEDHAAAAAAAAADCELLVSALNCAADMTDALLGAITPDACRDAGTLSILGAALRDEDSLDSAAMNTIHNKLL